MDNIWKDKRGTSLVEVLVVMVVLLVGIMTVIQMFPTGFGVVKAAESRTIATRLAQQELERWKSMSANLPAGILPIDDNYPPNVLNDQYPGWPFTAFKDNAGSWVRGNLLDVRWVREETTTIPAPGYFQTGTGTTFGSKYTLAFSPIDVYTDGDGLNGLTVKSGQLKRITSIGGYLPLLKQGQYAILYSSDSPTFHVAFPADARGITRTYYISYSYWAWDDGDSPVLLNVLDQPISPDPNLSDKTYWMPVTIDKAGYDHVGIEPNTDVCSRGFIMLDLGASWPPDPYTFKLTDPILGVLAFNPSAQNKYEYTALGKRPIEARIDYRIYDPRIIREDKVVPDVSDSAQDIPIKLALRFILNAGRPDVIGDGDPTDNPDEPTFEGLMRGANGRPQLGSKVTDTSDLIIPYSMLIVDLKTGLRVGVVGTGVPVDSIDYKTGVVHLPLTGSLIDYENNIVSDNVDLRGRNLRFLYRADGDWSVQCHKAYTNYSRVYDEATVNYRSYCLVSTEEGAPLDRLLFAPCDAGKTISVDYTYTTSDGIEHRMVGRACRISDTDDGAGHYYVDLDVPAATYEIKRISVVGVSFMARVVWRDGKHWRYVDLDTNLTRGGG